jgi:hypothetical protein
MAQDLEWSAPAKLFFWPASDGSEEDAVYPTLWDALVAAGEGDLSTAWIITQSGRILTPRLVRSLREAPAPRARKRSGAAALFAWARAAA